MQELKLVHAEDGQFRSLRECRELGIQGRYVPLGPCKQLLPLLHDTDTVLDLGAHIGTFSIKAAQRGARVRAVEPHAPNFDVLSHNAQHFPTTIGVMFGAVVPSSYEHSTVCLHGRPGDKGTRGSYSRSVIAHRGQTDGVDVPAFRLKDLMLGVTVLKVDVEGAEYLLDIPLHIGDVRALSVDFHQTRKRREEAEAIIAAIEAQGFDCVHRPLFRNTFDGDTAGVWARRTA